MEDMLPSVSVNNKTLWGKVTKRCFEGSDLGTHFYQWDFVYFNMDNQGYFWATWSRDPVPFDPAPWWEDEKAGTTWHNAIFFWGRNLRSFPCLGNITRCSPNLSHATDQRSSHEQGGYMRNQNLTSALLSIRENQITPLFISHANHQQQWLYQKPIFLKQSRPSVVNGETSFSGK